jgi:hypothetical protein
MVMPRPPQRHANSKPAGFWRSKTAIGLIIFLVIGAFLLMSEHRAHVLGILPYLLILACPLLHIFMHGGHGQHGSHDPDAKWPRGGDRS